MVYNFNKYLIPSTIITIGITYAINLISIYPAPINNAIITIPNIVNNTPKTLIIKVNIITTPFTIVHVNKAKSKRLRRVNYLFDNYNFFLPVKYASLWSNTSCISIPCFSNTTLRTSIS